MNWQSNCKVCTKRGKCETEKEMEKTYPVHIVIGCSACEPQPQTNADRIRAFSDEELALWKKQECPDNPRPCLKVHYRVDCTSCWLDWLKQEATE